MGNDESEKIGIYFQGLSGSRYCNTRIMPWSLVHDIISKYPLRRWCLFFCHVAFTLKHISGEKKIECIYIYIYIYIYFFLKKYQNKTQNKFEDKNKNKLK